MDQNRTGDQGQSQQGDRDRDRPNQAANKEPAEGSRENAGADQGGGITNRPLGRELEEQAQVPSRGHTKDEERGDA